MLIAAHQLRLAIVLHGWKRDWPAEIVLALSLIPWVAVIAAFDWLICATTIADNPMTAPNRRWFQWSLVAALVTASFGVGWFAGRARLRSELDSWTEEEGEVDPFDGSVMFRKESGKSHLLFPAEQDYQIPTPTMGTEHHGMGQP